MRSNAMPATKTKVATAMMFYMSAQNELAPRAQEDIDEISGNRKLENVALYILLDTKAQDPATRKEIRTTKIWALPAGARDTDFATPQTTPDVDVADSRVFSRFLGDAEDHFDTLETRQKILVLWGHGGGMVMLDQDPAPGQQLSRASIVDFAEKLEVRSRSPQDPLRFDIIAFDSCYMGVLETMHQFRGFADYALVSSTVVDASGYPYKPIVANLIADGPALNPGLAAGMIRNEYNGHYEKLGRLKRRYLFSCDLTWIGACAGALNGVGREISKLLDADTPERRVRRALEEVHLAAHADASYVGVLIFLKKLLRRFEGIADAAAYAKLQASAEALRSNVMKAFAGPLGASGTVPTSPLVWCPLNKQEFNSGLHEYARLDVSGGGNGGWIAMLRKFHNDTRPIPWEAALTSRYAAGVRPASPSAVTAPPAALQR
jgi:hypothetical protein